MATTSRRHDASVRGTLEAFFSYWIDCFSEERWLYLKVVKVEVVALILEWLSFLDDGSGIGWMEEWKKWMEREVRERDEGGYVCHFEGSKE